MKVRHFVGPNGARFRWTEPLPGWLEKHLATGEVTEEQPEPAKEKPATKKTDGEG